MALVMVLGIIAVLTITGTSLAFYATQNASSSTRSSRVDGAYSLAEAGINDALSVLSSSFQPMTATALPACTSPASRPLAGGTSTYCGSISGSVWTITGIGSLTNAGAARSQVIRKLTRTVNVWGLNSGVLVSAWSRLYNNDTSACFTIPTGITIPSTIGARGDMCLSGTAAITGASTSVAVGRNLTIGTGAIGGSATPVSQVDVGGTCAWGTQAPHPAKCLTSDNVWATNSTASPTGLVKPTVDFAYWYTNSKPGPTTNCTTGSFPGGFDSDTTYNGTNPALNLTPSGSSYTCQVTNGSTLVGELSWNNTTNVLTIHGTVFIDGPVTIGNNAQGRDSVPYHYAGRGTLYVSATLTLNGILCAGGSGATNCTSSMSSWDPTQNMMVIIAGGMNPPGSNDLVFTSSDQHTTVAFQGVLYAVHNCSFAATDGYTSVSGPVLCEQLSIAPGGQLGPPSFPAWPPLGSLLPGQIYGSTSASPDFLIQLGPQSG